MNMRRVFVVLLALASLVLTGAEGGCGAEGGTPKPNPDHGATRKEPAPGPDPSALAKAGQDPRSVLLHVDWEGYREFNIKWHNSQDPASPFTVNGVKPSKVGKGWRGFFEVTVVVDPDRPLAVSISAGPKLSKLERDGRAHCWIRHSGVIVDEDSRGAGPVLCAAGG